MPVPVEHRYRAVIEYDGTDFLGYQYQKIGRTVQGELEKVIQQVTQQTIRISGAGRTDAGVHATGQVIAFDLVWKHGLAALHRALNATLPCDVVIRDLKITNKNFHPRFDAVSRSYQYVVVHQPWPSVLQRRYAYHIRGKLDVAAMNEGAKYLIGSHDFASFGKPPQGKKTVRHIMEAVWSFNDHMLTFSITANAFLYRMVRRIVGTLIKVGRGQLQPGQVDDILQARDLTQSVEPAPAHGLCLVRVAYPDEVEEVLLKEI